MQGMGSSRRETPDGARRRAARTWDADSDDTLYSIPDLDATPLGRLSRRTRYQLISSGDLEALTINGRHCVTRSAVIALLRRRE